MANNTLKGLLGINNNAGGGLLSNPLFMSGLGLLQAGSKPGATIGSSLLPAVTSGFQTANTFGQIERQNKFKTKLASGEEITETDLAEAYPKTYAEYKIKQQFTKKDPLSKIGKINRDYYNGDMTKDQYEEAINEATGQKEFAPGDIEKDVNYLKKIFTDKTDAELATQVISWKTTEKAPTKEEFMGEAYATTLREIGSTSEGAKKVADEAGKYWDLNLSNVSSANITLDQLTSLQADGYTDFSFENGKIIATKDGQRGEITFE